MKLTTVTQTLDLTGRKPHFRDADHKYKSNNWLRMHGKPMRRNPFKMEQPLLVDEFHKLTNRGNTE